MTVFIARDGNEFLGVMLTKNVRLPIKVRASPFLSTRSIVFQKKALKNH